MSKEIVTIKFKYPVKLTNILETGLVFSDGTIISDEHEQDCCETVYADWKQLKDQLITEDEIQELVITGNPALGITLNGKYAVPCYNRQNGYYSAELAITITRFWEDTQVIDISEFVEGDIDF